MQKVLYILPLTHASHAIRGASHGETVGYQPFAVLAVLGLLCFIMAVRVVVKARD